MSRTNSPDQLRTVANGVHMASPVPPLVLMLGISLMMNQAGSKPDAPGETTETKTSGSCPVFSTQ